MQVGVTMLVLNWLLSEDICKLQNSKFGRLDVTRMSLPERPTVPDPSSGHATQRHLETHQKEGCSFCTPNIISGNALILLCIGIFINIFYVSCYLLCSLELVFSFEDHRVLSTFFSEEFVKCNYFTF